MRPNSPGNKDLRASVALVFGGLVSAAVAALGVIIGGLIVRRRADHVASRQGVGPTPAAEREL